MAGYIKHGEIKQMDGNEFKDKQLVANTVTATWGYLNWTKRSIKITTLVVEVAEYKTHGQTDRLAFSSHLLSQ